MTETGALVTPVLVMHIPGENGVRVRACVRARRHSVTTKRSADIPIQTGQEKLNHKTKYDRLSIDDLVVSHLHEFKLGAVLYLNWNKIGIYRASSPLYARCYFRGRSRGTNESWKIKKKKREKCRK